MNQLIKTLFFVFLGTLSACQLDEWQKPIDPTVIIPVPQLCNGSEYNCGMKLNEVIFPATLRSYCYAIGVVNYLLPSQKFPINRQLRDGIRAINLDVYYEGGQLIVADKTVPLNLGGSEPFSGVLNEIKSFMAENPREVIVVLINTTVTSIQIKDGLEQANLIDSLYSHTFGAPWPTLGKLIQDRDRLVLFSNSPDTGPGFSWLHPSSQYIAQTSLPTSRSNFDCAAPVTDPANMFYLLQHRVTSGFIVPTSNEDSARAVNSFEVLRKRIDDCTLSSDKRPNFIAVDYYTVGDLFGVCNSYLPIE